MLCSVGFQFIDPAVANTITELLLLPVQNVLQRHDGNLEEEEEEEEDKREKMVDK